MMGRLAFRRRLARLTLLSLTLGWGIAWASVEVVRHSPPDLLSWPWLQIAVGVWVSAWGGAAATLTRYLAAKYDGKPFHTRIEIIKDVFVAIVVGASSYLIGWWYQWPSMAVGLTLLLSGWLGVRILSVVADKFLLSIRNKTLPND